MADNRFYIIKDLKPACTFIYSGEPYSTGVYKEPVYPNPVKNVPDSQYEMMCHMFFVINDDIHAFPKDALEGSEIAGPKVYIGRSFIDIDYSLMGEMTSYQYAIKYDGENLFSLAHTNGGYTEAVKKIVNSVKYSEDKKDAWIPLDEVVGVYDRDLKEMKHAFDKFTISYYGSPYKDAPLDDEKTFRGIVDFGTDEAAIRCKTIDDAEYVNDMRALIERLYANGVKTRLYGYDKPSYDPLVDTKQAEEDEAWIKKFIEIFGDLEGISIWGFADEPGTSAFNYCAFIKNCFNKYDSKKRPVYINLGPRAHSFGVKTFYEEFSKRVRPDYYTYDRYPFFMTERGAEMTDPYFYSNFELQRGFAIDDSIDHGVILGAIKVGADPLRSDITPYFMRWQTNLLAAYGARYIEYYVYYYAHDFSILDSNNEPTWRWNLCVETTKYLKAVFSLLDNLRLDAVFHLENSDGGYDPDVIPYYGYRGVGEVKGNDAILSFYEDGVIVLTDKHADEFDGGDHDITLTGFAAKEWFNPETRAWEAAENCPAAKVGEDGLTVHFTLASQYIFR